MPIETIWSESTIHWECSALVTKDELFTCIVDNFYDDERSEDIHFEIFQFTDASSIEISNFDIMYFAASDIGRRFSHDNVTVIFVGTNPKILKQVHYYLDAVQKRNKSWNFVIYEQLSDAFDLIEKEKSKKFPVLKRSFNEI